MKAFDMVIVGVGGQGTLLASRILGHLALKAGMDVKVSEVHGMSQRGGSVITYVRVGKEVHSPMVAAGEADYLLSFEQLEAVRAASYLKRSGLAIVNTQRILPMPVITGAAVYPEKALELINGIRIESADALTIAEKCGSQKALNLVMLGMLSRHLEFSEEAWQEAITACLPAKLLPINLSAFARGREL